MKNRAQTRALPLKSEKGTDETRFLATGIHKSSDMGLGSASSESSFLTITLRMLSSKTSPINLNKWLFRA